LNKQNVTWPVWPFNVY